MSACGIVTAIDQLLNWQLSSKLIGPPIAISTREHQDNQNIGPRNMPAEYTGRDLMSVDRAPLLMRGRNMQLAIAHNPSSGETLDN